MMRDLAERRPGYTLHAHLTSEKRRLRPSDLDEICPDWREREAFVSGPGAMLDAMRGHWGEHGDVERLADGALPAGDRHAVTPRSARAGRVRFRVTDVDAECGPGVSILVGGRGGRRQAHLRLPDGDLPHLRRPAAVWKAA